MIKTISAFFIISLLGICPLYAAPQNQYASLYNQIMNFQIINSYKKASEIQILNTYDKISALEQRYDAAVAREQSLANRMLGGVAIGAGGIGGMMLASGLAEQRADENAERDMAAYLATFKCDYGAGMTITGGETNIQLPTSNNLLELRNEYITLAADLKTRKEILGISFGIESEIITDATESGLYDNAATGKTDGGYTSLSRALMDETGTDATKWAAQKSETAQQVKTGATVGGVGVIGGAVGNILINNVFDGTNKKDAVQ